MSFGAPLPDVKFVEPQEQSRRQQEFDAIMNGPRASDELSLRLKRCFGAMRILLSFLDQYGQVGFQILDKWWYNIGVSRIQTRFLGRGFYTHDKVYYIKSDFDHSIWCYTTSTQKMKRIDCRESLVAKKFI